MPQKRKNKSNLPFDPKGEIFRWGPVPGYFIYVSIFAEVHYRHFRAKYHENWAETFFLFKDGRMFWVNDLAAIQEAGERVFRSYLLPKSTRQKIYAEWQGYVHSLKEQERKLDKIDWSQTSDQDLLNWWNELHQLYIKFWVAGSVPELANYGSIHLLEEKLRRHITDDGERAAALEALTAPTRLSFYQEEEIALAAAADLKKHQQEYFWLKHSYAGSQILPVSFFAERKAELAADLKSELKKKLKQAEQRKKELQKEFGLPAEVMAMAEAISDGIGWQDERKKYIFIVLHYEDLMLRETARRFGYNFTDLRQLWYFEAGQIIEGNDLQQKIEERKRGFGVQFFHTCRELSPEEAASVWQAYEVSKTDASASAVKGIVASKGRGKKVRGRIHILLDPTKIDTFQDGEILVAPMTSPEYIFAMRKAAAILTDTGGLTSHAAIVSRELGIPCLVGTKMATKVFKNGDVVEVDPAKGTARKK